MHLVVDQVMQFQEVHESHGHGAIEGFSRTTVVKRRLGLAFGKFKLLGFLIGKGQIEHHANLLFGGAVKHGRCKRHAVTQVLRQAHDFFIRKAIEVFFLTRAVIDLVQEGANLFDLTRLFILEHAIDLPAQALSGPAQMHFENLTDVHTARHAERIQANVHRTTVCHVGHILNRADLGNHTLVTVAARHLVTGLQAALLSDKDLDHLQNSGRQFVAALEFFFLLGVKGFVFFALSFDHSSSHFNELLVFIGLHAKFEQIVSDDAVEHFGCERASAEFLGAPESLVIFKLPTKTREHVRFDNLQGIFQVVFVTT